MNPDNLGLLFNVFDVALALFALWIAGRIVLRNLPLLQNYISSSRAMQLIIWFALGEIFILPLLDLLGLIQLITTLSSETSGEAYTLWGRVPPFVYDLTNVFTILFIYSATLMIGWKHLLKRMPKILESIQINSFEKIFSLLAVAAFVNHIIRFIIFSVIWQQTALEVTGLDKGIAGFFAGWLVGLLIIGITIYVMYERIERQTEKIGEISD